MRRKVIAGSLGSRIITFVLGLAALAACGRYERTLTSPALDGPRRTIDMVYEYLHPEANVQLGSWNGDWSQMDETTPNDDVDYAYRVHWGTTPVRDSMIVRMGTPTQAPDSLATCWVLVRYKFTGNYDPNTPQPTSGWYALDDGSGTTITSRSFMPATSNYVTDSVAFIAGHLNWNWGFHLKVGVQEKAKTSIDEISMRVTWLAVKCPTAF